jgi:SagB-type dehydrogenase family enzyme
MTNDDPAPLFRLFWENSSLNRARTPGFAASLEADARRVRWQSQLFYGGADRRLPTPKDKLFRIQSQRASDRRFSGRPLSSRQLGSLFAGFDARPDGRRLLPSGGGKYPVETFALLFSVAGHDTPTAVYYNADNHSLSPVGPCPPFNEIAMELGILPAPGDACAPAACFLFVVFPTRSTLKYGERGGRFALIEVGHYAQNLGLRLAHEGLAGYELGGVREARMARILGLEAADAMVMLGYAVGSRV